MLYCKNEYVEREKIINVPDNNSLDDVIELLKKYKNENQNIIIEYKRNYLFTYDLDRPIDLIYSDFYGLSKDDYIKCELIKKGKQLIYPEKDKDWQIDVNSWLNNKEDLFILLDILEAIEKDPTFKLAKELYISNINIYGLLSKIIRYSKKGPEFVEFLINNYKEHLLEKDKNNVDKIMIIINRQKEKNKEHENNKTERDIPVIIQNDNKTIDDIYIEIRQAQNRDETLLFKYQGIDILTNMITSIEELKAILNTKKH